MEKCCWWGPYADERLQSEEVIMRMTVELSGITISMDIINLKCFCITDLSLSAFTVQWLPGCMHFAMYLLEYIPFKFQATMGLNTLCRMSAHFIFGTNQTLIWITVLVLYSLVEEWYHPDCLFQHHPGLTSAVMMWGAIAFHSPSWLLYIKGKLNTN